MLSAPLTRADFDAARVLVRQPPSHHVPAETIERLRAGGWLEVSDLHRTGPLYHWTEKLRSYVRALTPEQVRAMYGEGPLLTLFQP